MVIESVDAVAEIAVITNRGDRDQDLAGWKLSAGKGQVYTFPSFILGAGARVRVHTGTGTNSATDLYWGRRSNVWNNEGDTGILYDATGKEVSQYSY